MDSLNLSEEQLIELIKIHRPELHEKQIKLKERCMTNEGGVRLYFEVR